MKKLFLPLISLLLTSLSCINAFAQRKTVTNDKTERPRLVVGIVVDQMRWDYLYRFYDKYGKGGFKRLLNQGFSCENTFINYLPSATAVGHTTVYTGSVPSISGIAGNEWVDQLTGRSWYCTEDTLVQSVGSKSAAGKMSPRNLLVSTITDELRLATNFRSKAVGVSIKDRAAILPVGHSATGAFWFDESNGHFVTSSYYMKELPEWVNQFNKKDAAQKMVAGGWKTLNPLNTYTQSTEDNEAWEGLMRGKKTPEFPYDIASLYKDRKGIIRQTPFGNTLTLQFAEAAIDGYELGEDKDTDFLTINCASTDYVGHMFGGNSIEVEDTYLRLDKDLELFFNSLDKKIGNGQYLVFLTADHGSAHAQGFMAENKFPTGFWDTDMLKSLNDLLAKQTGVSNLVLTDVTIGACYQVNFDFKKMDANHLSLDSIKISTLNFLRKQEGILYAVDMDQVAGAPIPSRIKEWMINGYNYKRSGIIQVIPQTGWMPEYSRKGTTHGGWNPYDTHIPLVFMGWKIKPGSTNRTVYMTDIAPTVAAMLHIQMPSGSIGDVITEVTGKSSN